MGIDLRPPKILNLTISCHSTHNDSSLQFPGDPSASSTPQKQGEVKLIGIVKLNWLGSKDRLVGGVARVIRCDLV